MESAKNFKTILQELPKYVKIIQWLQTQSYAVRIQFINSIPEPNSITLSSI